MRTEVINVRSQAEGGTKRGAEIIRAGGLVAFPTETVYGLGANGFDDEAVRGIFAAKGRPADNPLILHVSKKSDVKDIWRRVPKQAQVLMDTFWPGPLTIIAPRTDEVPDAVTAGLDTVAVRMPADKTARLLIGKAGVPIAAPSANLSGKPSPTTAQHVLDDMDGRIPLILDGGPCKYGVESTVLTLAGKQPTILRPGAVTLEMLYAVLGDVAVADSILSPMHEGEVAASPGMKYKHYAPNAEVVCVRGEPEAVAKKLNALYREAERAGRSCEIMMTENLQRLIQSTNALKHLYKEKSCVILGDRDHPEELCAKLFYELRELDKTADLILAEGIETDHYGLAYMNRLLRAAGFQVFEAR